MGGIPSCNMKGYAADVVHVAVRNEDLVMGDGTLRATPDIERHLEQWQEDTCLLRLQTPNHLHLGWRWYLDRCTCMHIGCQQSTLQPRWSAPLWTRTWPATETPSTVQPARVIGALLPTSAAVGCSNLVLTAAMLTAARRLASFGR